MAAWDWFGDDPVVRRSMEDLLARDIVPSDDLVFAYGQRVWDPVRRQVISREVELKPDGVNIQVTNENKHEYVAMLGCMCECVWRVFAGADQIRGCTCWVAVRL